MRFTALERRMLRRACANATTDDLDVGLDRLGITEVEWQAFRSAVKKLDGRDPGPAEKYAPPQRAREGGTR